MKQCKKQDAEWHSLYGMACVELNDLSSAEKHFTQAIKKNPKSKNAYTKRALVYLGQRRIEPAIRDFEKVLTLDPNNRAARYYLHILKNSPTVIKKYDLFML